jgi:hypothetical protein
MASIFIFCHPNELQAWIADVCEREDLGVICFGDREFGDIVPPRQVVLNENIGHVFLFPNGASPGSNLAMNDVRQRDWGWVMIRPGGLKLVGSARVLLFSEIHGEKRHGELSDPDKWVRRLKQTIKPHVLEGVRGRNTRTGGQSDYPRIWYTREAKELLDSGVAWKQFPNDNAEFNPLEST